MNEKTILSNLNGMSLKNVKSLPHPTFLKKWSDNGYYFIDEDLYVFKLTKSGLNFIQQAH